MSRSVTLKNETIATTRPRLRRLGIVLACALLAACTNITKQSTVRYNEGLSASSNELILKNILRSAKGYPTYYSATGDFNQSSSNSASPQLGVNFNSGGGVAASQGVTLGFDAGPSSSSNASVSSLETSEFLTAMYTPIDHQTLLALVAAQDLTHLNLVVFLTVDGMRVTQSEYRSVINAARSSCDGTRPSDPALKIAICQVEFQGSRPPRCSVELDSFGASRSGFVDLRNDPTSICNYEKFRRFVEAIAVLGPEFVDSGTGTGAFHINLGLPQGGSVRLFRAGGTGYDLRSPNATISYLGEVVRRSFLSNDPAQYGLTTSDGSNGPIFRVVRGTGRGNSGVKTTLDDETFFIPNEALGSRRSDYSNRTLAIAKDLISVNIARSSLAQSNTVLLRE